MSDLANTQQWQFIRLKDSNSGNVSLFLLMLCSLFYWLTEFAPMIRIVMCNVINKNIFRPKQLIYRQFRIRWFKCSQVSIMLVCKTEAETWVILYLLLPVLESWTHKLYCQCLWSKAAWQTSKLQHKTSGCTNFTFSSSVAKSNPTGCCKPFELGEEPRVLESVVNRQSPGWRWLHHCRM